MNHAATMKKLLDHSNYQDYAMEMPPEEGSAVTCPPDKIYKNGASPDQNFPVKLHYMLSDMEADGLDYIISWQAHGRCFTIHKPKEFVDKILQLWFRQSKLSSFQRQLNLYGFKRITQGPDKGAHYHELFLRGKRFLAHRIPRMKIKGEGPRKSAKPSQEPNFYAMPPLPPHGKGVPLSPPPHIAGVQGLLSRVASKSLPQARSAGVNFVLEQALARQAFLSSCTPHHLTAAASSTGGMASLSRQSLLLTSLPTTTTNYTSPRYDSSQPQALAIHHQQRQQQQQHLSPSAMDNFRENELLTAVLLDRLRHR